MKAYPFCIVLSLFLLSFSACSLQEEPPYVILISFDGFRYDYVANHDMPHFEAFIQKGTQAEALIPSFPSKTFPNHYTLVTGLYPGHQGLVDNEFYDPESNTLFAIRDRKVVEDPQFYGGTPLWQLAQENGLPAASYFWVGSEAPIRGAYPDYYQLYDEQIPNTERVDQVVKWLQLPEEKRPHFISLYFSMIDTQGHNFGPDSPEIATALKEADALLGNLMQQLQSMDLPVNVIIVSDHGMMEIESNPENFIYLPDLHPLQDSSFVVVNAGTQAHIYVKDTTPVDSLYQALQQQEASFKIYKRDSLPAHWYYNHPRIGDLLLVADPGYYITDASREVLAPRLSPGKKTGKHGFDPELVKEMWGIFYAQGPNIKSTLTIPAFHNVHVYPFVAKLLHLKPPPDIDGKTEVLEDIYVP